MSDTHCYYEIALRNQSRDYEAQLAAKDAEIAALLLLLREIRDNAWPGVAFGARIDVALSRLPYDAPDPAEAMRAKCEAIVRELLKTEPGVWRAVRAIAALGKGAALDAQA